MKNRILSVLLLGLMLIAMPMAALAQASELKSLNINVETPGTLMTLVQQEVSDYSEVGELTVSGSLNLQDLNSLQYFKNLTNLDLSATDITSMRGCSNLSKLAIVKLPETVTEVYDNAFYYCSSLTSINLPNAQSIGYEAFYRCSSLTSIDLPNVQSIGDYAFNRCSLTSIDLPNAQSIGSSAFLGCSSLTSIDLPNAQSIGSQAFSSCSSLISINLPNVQIIGFEVFGACSSLTSIDLPNAQRIDSGAFAACRSLKNIDLPGCLKELGSNAFSGCDSITDVYCHRIAPLTTQAFSSVPVGATLHVPAMSIETYKTHDSWYRFTNFVALDEKIENLEINGDFTLTSTEGLSNNMTLEVYDNAHLTVMADSTLRIGNFQMGVDFVNYDYGYNTNYNYVYHIPTLINYSPISADTVAVSVRVRTGEWNFLTLPFDCKVGDIEKEDGTYWVVRKYSGANRASGEGKTWLTLTDDDIIAAGEGFILQCNNGNSSASFVFHAIDNANKNTIFAYNTVTQTLHEYNCLDANDRNWNLVGNPFPAYYNTASINEEAVITAWDPNSYYGYYTAYSTLDDNYVARPFEAYFIQKPKDSNISYDADGRMHSASAKSNTRAKALRAKANADRKVLNFHIGTDRARVVINPSASESYEMGRDASKFMSLDADAPQIFVNRNGMNLAIDESPLSQGTATLGIYTAKAEQQTITLDTRNHDGAVYLTDNLTGKTVNLATESYTFTTQPGTNASRFTVSLGTADGIETIHNSESTIQNYHNLAGQRVNDNAKGIVIINGKKVRK